MKPLLNSLHIENIAVAKELNIDLKSGFTVLTGETGAGKSIIIDSINFLIGGRVSRELIRTGETRASVSALFSCVNDDTRSFLSEYGIEPDENGEIYLMRSINADGKSISKINGRTVPASTLKAVGTALINIHGQNDSVLMMQKNAQLSVLDEYADTENELAQYVSVYNEMTEIKKKIESLTESSREKTMMIDILKYQIAEIDNAKLNNPKEEEQLSELKLKLKNIEKITKQSGLVYRALLQNEKGMSAVNLMEKAVTALNSLAGVIEGAADMASRLESMRYEVEDIAESVSRYVDEEDEDPEKRLNAIESRLNQIHKLKLKYGEDISQIKKFRAEAASKLEDMESSDIKIAEYTALYEKKLESVEEYASLLSEKRQCAARVLSESVGKSLAFLDMPKVKFSVAVRRLTEQNGGAVYAPHGGDDVEFMVSTNPGEPFMPMSKIASGGELSRIMLALKSELSEKNGAGTLIFDEIDTGVSGKTSEKIGIKMKSISKSSQVICVTHSAQVAASADNHCKIEKIERDGRAEAVIHELDINERIAEIARIIGGISVTEAQLDVAREMIENGNKY